ncbi:MAG TPA: hypothetical protein VHL78_07190 [Actinomycetota bacterium]|nr:hypothetical protein [Actinomycetota bacterium]
MDKIQKHYQRLRRSAEGREAIRQLMYDLDAIVSVTAASHSVAYFPEEARRRLEAIRDSRGPGSMEAMTALYALEDGSFNVDWS